MSTHTGLQISVLEAEVSDLEKELALRDEMEAALKETLRELERAAARQQTGAQQVRQCACLFPSWHVWQHRERCLSPFRPNGIAQMYLPGISRRAHSRWGAGLDRSPCVELAEAHSVLRCSWGTLTHVLTRLRAYLNLLAAQQETEASCLSMPRCEMLC